MRSLTIFVAFCAAAFAQDSLPKAYLESPVLREGQNALWHDPGPVEALDFRNGIGGRELVPAPPFTFEDEDNTGTTPKVSVHDGKGRHWVIKFGSEARPDTFCTRLAWAMGYYVEPNYLIADGIIQGTRNLQRARKVIDESGRFQDGRFQLRSKEPKYLRVADWAWDDNPFIGTPELNGLKILMMLLSNWDDKDSRDQERRGSNTAIYQYQQRYYFFIDDWGGAMGNWGKYLTRSKWNADSYLKQSSNFVSIENGEIHWGYRGQHSALMTRNLRFSDAAWLMQYLGRVTDAQLRDGLLASGATEEQAHTYVAAMRMRIGQLQQLSVTVSSR